MGANSVDVVANKLSLMNIDICKVESTLNSNESALGMIDDLLSAFEPKTECGFAKITLSGTKSDWVLLRTKAFRLLSGRVTRKWGYEWKASLLPVLDRFVAAFDGKIDCRFWNSLCQSNAHCRLSGWFNVLFPYICTANGQFVTNPFCEAYFPRANYAKNGAQSANVFPLGPSSAAVQIRCEQNDYKMKFTAG